VAINPSMFSTPFTFAAREAEVILWRATRITHC